MGLSFPFVESSRQTKDENHCGYTQRYRLKPFLELWFYRFSVSNPIGHSLRCRK
jgi:hypothetical protein